MLNNSKTKLALEREYSTNRSNCRVTGAIILCIVVYIALCMLRVIPYDYHPVAHKLAAISALIMLVGLIVCVAGRYSKPYHKYILIFFMELSAATLYSAIGIDAVSFFVMPLLISGRYVSRKICAATYVTSIVLNGSAGYAYAWLNRLYYHDIGWTLSVGNIFSGMVVPLVLITTVMAVCVFGMVNGDKKSVIQILQAKEKAAAKETEFKTGAELQMNSLPRDFNIAPDGEFSVYARLLPSKETAGDFYDFFIAGDGRAVFVIGDVSDKGIPAALYMMSARNTVRALCGVMNDPARIVKEANRILLETSNDAFVTLFIAFIDTETGAGEYVNAGHDTPIIRFNNGSCGFLNCEPQPLVGAFDFVEYKSNPLQMEKGSVIFLYTDGINEALNNEGEEFGVKRLCQMVRDCGEHSPEAICNTIETAIKEFADNSKHYDDRTILALKWEKEMGITNKKTMAVCDESITEMIDEVNDVLHTGGCPEDIVRNIDVAIDEIGANLVEHSQADTLVFEYECGENHIRMTFTDNGIQFNPEQSRVYETRDILTPGGLGIHFIQSLMDEVCYGYENDHNVYTMTKYWD